MRQRFGQTAVGCDRARYVVDPALERIERRSRVTLSSGEPIGWIQAFDFSLDPIQLSDVAQRRFSMRASFGGMQFEEQAADMRPAANFGDALGKKGFIAALVVHDEVAAERTEEALGMLAAATGAEVEHGDRQLVGGAVCEQIRACCLAGARIQ